MDRRFAELLPEASRREVLEVEGAIEGEIEIAPLTPEFAALVGRSDIAGLDSGMQNGRSFVRILLPPGSTSIPSIAHEVMHAHRMFVQSVWSVTDAAGRLKGPPARLENDLEHLDIVPREIALFPSQRSYWESEQAESITKALTQPALQRVELMLLWLTSTKLSPGLIERKRLEKAITKAGLKVDARLLISRIDRAAGDKLKMAAALINAVGFNPSMLRMMRYLPRERRIEYCPIATG
jgi:hypothetical protein